MQRCPLLITVSMCVALMALSSATSSDAFPKRARGAGAGLPDTQTPPSPASPTWSVFLGTGWNQNNKDLIAQYQRDGKWINPFTGQPLQDAQVFVFGRDNALLEAVRIVGDHLQTPVLSSREELRGQHFDYALCHSNGCTNALSAQRDGLVQVDTFFAMGTDWTNKNFRPGDLQGANLVFFTMKTDPIWKLPALDLTSMGTDGKGVGLQLSLPFEKLTDIPVDIKNLVTQGRADPDRFPVVRLDPPPGEQSTLRKPFQAHRLVDSYFPAIQKWLQADGPQQQRVQGLLPQATAPEAGASPAFKPAALSPQAREGWLRNQAIVGHETLGKSGQGTTPALGTPLQQGSGNAPNTGASPAFDPATMSPQESAGWQRNQAIVAGETLGRAGQGATPALGTPLQQGPGNGTMPPRIGQDPRGGVAADIHISPKDFDFQAR